jgi:hypothetical protein
MGNGRALDAGKEGASALDAVVAVAGLSSGVAAEWRLPIQAANPATTAAKAVSEARFMSSHERALKLFMLRRILARVQK